MTIEDSESRLGEGQQCLYKLLREHLNRPQASEQNSSSRFQESEPVVPKQDWQVGQTYKVRLEGMNKDGLFLVKSMKNKANYEELKAALIKLDHEDLKPIDPSELKSDSHKVYLCRTRQTFVRGKILEAYPTLGICSIRDIDECKSYLVRLESVFGILPEYCELPARVAECVLQGVNSRTLAFRPAINNALSLVHGNMLMTVVIEEKRFFALVRMTLPCGLDLSDLIVQNIHQNFHQLPLLCENTDSVFTECSRIVDMQRFIMPALRNESQDDTEDLQIIEGQVHVEVELFFRKAAESGGFVYVLQDLYGAVYEKIGRHIPLRPLGYRSWYSFLYTYSHLFHVKTFTSDHSGRIFIHIEDILGKDVDDGFTGVESFVQLKPEILLTLDQPLKQPIQRTSTSSESQAPHTSTSTSEASDSRKNRNNSQPKQQKDKRPRHKTLNVNVHLKDIEYVEKIAKMIPFPPEHSPNKLANPVDLYLVPKTGYYIFYPTDASVMHNLPHFEDQGSKRIKAQEMGPGEAVKSPVTNKKESGNIKSQKLNLLNLDMYSAAGMEVNAVLVGMDNNGFVHFSVNDPQVEQIYSEMLQELQEFYASESARQKLQLPRSAIQLGVNVVGKVGDQYRRVRVYQHYTSKQSCWVVDLESREFHLLPESDLFKLTTKVAELPPKAHPGILSGIENYLMTPILPTLLSRVELEKTEVQVKIIEPFHQHLQIPVVQLKVEGKDLSDMLMAACLEKDSRLGRKGPDWDGVKTFLKLYLLGHDK